MSAQPKTVQTLIDFPDPAGRGRLVRGAFGAPRQVLQAHTAAQVRPVLDAVEALARQGRWCVGYLRYEAACAFDSSFAVHDSDGPLAWFGVHDAMQPWPETDAGVARAHQWNASLTRERFGQRMADIHQAIAAGELYQVNYTSRLNSEFQGDARAFFMALLRTQPSGYAAFIDTGLEQVLSVSPELFFDWRDGHILARPMKGTAPRGATVEEDQAQAAQLRTSAKERAENVMIVDLVRNDLSRIAQPFSVHVPRLFETEALPTVWQMSSDIQADTRPGTTLADVFAALFPCGSITGAPKVQAMRMIRSLEPDARGVYCGAVGVVRPGGAAIFNVPIRTVVLREGQAKCGIGSGITAGASVEGEWQEWRHKRAFLERASQPFDLLETLALHEGVLRDAPAHLARMESAALHFGYPWNAAHVQAQLARVAATYRQGHWRIRLRLDAFGWARVEAHVLENTPATVQLALAATAFEAAGSEFVRFKTTQRRHYDAFTPTDPDIFDTLLWNEHGEITECTRGNVAALLGGRWVTPPLRCGLLGGVGRARCLREGRMSEAVVRLDDLPQVKAWAFVNSLRGWVGASLRVERIAENAA